jgi:hypothetical protein
MEGKREVFKSRVRQAALRATTIMQWKLAIGMFCDKWMRKLARPGRWVGIFSVFTSF